jgi:hypothetical protein
VTHYSIPQRLHPPSGPAAMLLPTLILGPLGLVLLGGGVEALHTNPLLGIAYFLGGGAVCGFLGFCFLLHIRAQQVWTWHLRTGRVPSFRKGGFWKGALVGGAAGLLFAGACGWFGWTQAEHPIYGEWATMAFYLAYLYGPFVIGVPALTLGWAKRAWDRSAMPS